MNQSPWKETEFEEGTDSFMKKACSLPNKFIPVVNGIASVGNQSTAVEGTLFKKLIETGCVKACTRGYEVTDFGATLFG